jgi:membrane protease YdiL (CAAX protease family)
MTPRLWQSMNVDASHKRWAPYRGGVMLVGMMLVPLGLPVGGWPWYLLVPVAFYVVVVLAAGPLRRSMPKWTVGTVTGWPLLIAAAVILGSSGALIAYRFVFAPDVTALAATIPIAAFRNVVVAAICISVLNAILEELIFRGVFYEALVGDWGAAFAVLVTGAAFGVSHATGYPPDPLGVAMATTYGICLGCLRAWTGGLGLAIGCHVCADATIFAILVQVDAFSEIGG